MGISLGKYLQLPNPGMPGIYLEKNLGKKKNIRDDVEVYGCKHLRQQMGIPTSTVLTSPTHFHAHAFTTHPGGFWGGIDPMGWAPNSEKNLLRHSEMETFPRNKIPRFKEVNLKQQTWEGGEWEGTSFFSVLGTSFTF